MSIFEAKEFYSTVVTKNPEEEFDRNSIAIGNIDNDPSGNAKIAVSSTMGYLRIYEPHFHQTTNDLLFEKLYDAPILQISTGNFIINSSDVQLCILQSKRFFVVQISNLKSATNVRLCYDHKLKRNGNNFTIGKIGEKNYDIVFIQSIDGAVSIYEQDSLVNIVLFSEVIFPGALAFLNRKDALLISNTAYEIECYDYNNIATTKKTSNNTNTITHQWKASIGELALVIEVVNNTRTKNEDIVVLSETMLNLINSNGKVCYQRKLDYEPLTLKAYNITDDNYQMNEVFDLMCMIATSAHHILVYKGLALAWAVKVYDVPIFLGFADVDRVNSLIVSLSDTGKLGVLYLGTTQVKNRQIIHSKQIDQDFLIKETERLNNVVQSYSKGVPVAAEDQLNISADVNPNMLFANEPGDKFFYKDNYGKIFLAQVTLSFSYDGKIPATDIRINITTPINVICDDPIFTITSLSAANGEKKKVVTFKVLEAFYPTFSTVDIYATYYTTSSSGKMFQSTNLSIELPLQLFLRVSIEGKKNDSACKITVCTDKPPMVLSEIFKDLTENYSDASLVKSKPHLITFIYPNKTEVTIIVSKANGKYRIQSNQYEPLLFITNQLVMRLNEKFEYSIQIYIDDPINFQKYITIITNHYNMTNKKKALNIELEKYTTLYTTIQKSLLNKYKEKNPPQLYNVDFLLKNVYKEICNKADNIKSIENEIKLCHRDIVIWTELVIYLLKLRSKMSDEDYDIIRSAFPLDNIHDNEFSFEDVTLTNMGNLILFYFKNNSNLQEIKEMKDLEKWQKYFVTLFKEVIANKGLGKKEKEKEQ